jgi:mono/diheme cytochrome c family protein
MYTTRVSRAAVRSRGRFGRKSIGAFTALDMTKQVTNGGGGMPPFKGQLTAAEIKAVANYVTTRVAKQ